MNGKRAFLDGSFKGPLKCFLIFNFLKCFISHQNDNLTEM